MSLVEGARLAVEQGLIKGKGGSELGQLVRDLDRWGRMGEDTDHAELAGIVLDESGYTTMWQNDKTPEAPGRLENLKELVKALEEFDNLQGFLEHVSLIMDNDKGGDGEKVSIMTLHAAKGLEFPAVFLPGWEDGLFPSQRSMDESGLKGLEEERRLAYVGITRAEEVCTIFLCRQPQGVRPMAIGAALALHRRTSRGSCRGPDPARRLYGGGYGAAGMASPATQMMAGSDLHQKAAEANVYNSPGWRRLQSRAQQRPVSQPTEARNTVIDATAISSYALGERVCSPEIRLWRGDGNRGRQARDRLRKGGHQEGRRALHLCGG